jgi:hypothetical protein
MTNFYFRSFLQSWIFEVEDSTSESVWKAPPPVGGETNLAIVHRVVPKFFASFRSQGQTPSP